MNIVLKNQIEASEKSAHELEDELQGKHRLAMVCHNVQDLARSAVTLFSEIGDSVGRWQTGLDTSAHQNSEELTHTENEWDDLYRRLAGVFEKTAGFVQLMEKEGFAVAGKSEFLASWQDLRGIICFSRDRVAIAVEQSRRGEVRSLGEIELELRDLPND